MNGFVSLARDQNGAAGAEMALMVPLLLVIMFGSFEMGHFFWNEHKVVKAVRDGARFAGRQPFSKYTCTNSTITDTTVSDATLVTQIKNVTRTGTVAGTGTPKVFGWDDSEITVTFSCPATATTTGIYKGLTNAPRVKVAATVPYPSLFGTLGFDAANINLNAQSQSAVMGI